MSIKVNGKTVSQKEALGIIDNEKVRISSVQVSLKNTKKKPGAKLTSNGFTISKGVVGELCRAMDRAGADIIKYALNGVPSIMGRNLTVIIEVPRPEPKDMKKLVRRFAEYLMEISG